MPSDVNYYEKMNVAELLRYSANFYEVDCEPRIKELADTFALDLDRKILDLSQGNKKKVSILQCLIHRPKLLILDEPTSGLDPLMQAKFFNILKQENQAGTTVFFSSHTLSEVQKMCKRVAIIKEGKIIAVEDIESLRKKQLRKVQIEFAAASELRGFEFPDILSSQVQDSMLSFIYAGNMEDLIVALSHEKVVDLIIEEPTLEEIFLHYYDDEKEGERSPKYSDQPQYISLGTQTVPDIQLVWCVSIGGLIVLGMAFFPLMVQEDVMQHMTAFLETGFMKSLMTAFGANVTALPMF